MKAEELLDYKNWVVVGDVLNSSKYAYKILNSLKSEGYNTVGINPSVQSSEVYKSLKDVPFTIDVVDLCINPIKGLKILEEVYELNIGKVLIQPGAESDEIISFCKTKGITAIEGCALVELSKK